MPSTRPKAEGEAEGSSAERRDRDADADDSAEEESRQAGGERPKGQRRSFEERALSVRRSESGWCRGITQTTSSTLLEVNLSKVHRCGCQSGPAERLSRQLAEEAEVS